MRTTTAQMTARRAPCPPLVTESDLDLLDDAIGVLAETDPATWWAGPTYRSPCGTKHCALAHLEAAWGIEAMERFEATWSTSYVIGAINDGDDPAYPGPDPKTRCMAYLEDLRSRAQPATTEALEMECNWCEGLELPFAQMLAHVRTEFADTTENRTLSPVASA